MLITEAAPAKINLALHVRARRPDGYHEIETLFAFCRDGDVVGIEKAAAPNFRVTGPFAAALGSAADNLVTHAVQAFTATFHVNGAHAITLDKRLPVASGIGGGSADAAATLRAFARLYGKSLDDPYLAMCAASLGSDVPACLLGRTALGVGRGETLQPVAGLSGLPTLLVNPGIAVSTARVFAAWDGIDRGPIADGPLLDRAQVGRNDLEAPARALAPAIGDVMAALASTAPVLARMSGSGATCFALYRDIDSRAAAAAAVRSARPDWWLLETALA